MSICNKNKKNNNYNKNSDDNNNNNNNNDASPMRRSPSFYRRPLPSHLTAFSSHTGRTVFREALECGFMEQYFPLAEQYHTQSEPAYCGLGTLAMILNALQIDPDRQWKGPWRWFSEEMLDCCKPLSVIKETGTTLAEFSCLARCNGAAADTTFADISSEEEFRNAIKKVTSNEEQFMVVSFDRSTLKQTGDGHFSPIAAYHPEEDLVLVLDVARFKYPSYWVQVSELWEALLPVDTSTSRSRGFVVLSRPPVNPPILYRIRMPRRSLQSRYQSCQRAARKLFSQVFAYQVQREASSASNAESLVQNILSMLPRDLVAKVEQPKTEIATETDKNSPLCRYNATNRNEDDIDNNNNNNNGFNIQNDEGNQSSLGIRIECQCSKTHSEAVDELLMDIQKLRLFSIVKYVLSTKQWLSFNDQTEFSCHEAEVMTIFILSLLAPRTVMIKAPNSDSITEDSSLESFENHLQSIDLSALYHSDDQAVVKELNIDENVVSEAVRNEVIAVRYHLDVLATSMDEGLSDGYKEKECPSSGPCCHESDNNQFDMDNSLKQVLK